MDIAISRWLSVLPTPKMLKGLADLFKREHRDTWLAEFLKARQNPQAVKLLQTSIDANRSGRPVEAFQTAVAARDLFAYTHNRPGAARSEFEAIYALQRESQPLACLRELRTLANLTNGRNYAWLEVQMALENASCEGMIEHFDLSRQHVKQALYLSEHHAYPVLHLRALGFQASLATNEGRSVESWSTNLDGLNAFWTNTYTAERAYQFYSDLELLVETEEERHLAVVLQREALHMAEESKRPEIVAIGHFRLGGLLHGVQEEKEAQQQFLFSSRLFGSLPPSPSTLLYSSYCDILMATIDLELGNYDSARRHLSAVTIDVEKTPNFSLQWAYWKAKSLLAAGEHDPNEFGILRHMILVGDRGFTSLPSEKDRWDWDNSIGYAYRRLLELKLDANQAPASTLISWELYKLRQTEKQTPRADNFKPRNSNSLLQKALRLHNSTIITYALLPHRAVAWVSDDRGISAVQLRAKPTELEPLIREFYRLCSDPNTSTDKLKNVGSILYEMLIRPIEPRLDNNRTLFIESDGILGLVPWAALVMPNGTFLAISRTIVNCPDLSAQRSSHESQIEQNVLVVYSGSLGANQRNFLPLPHAEAEAASVASVYPHSKVLYGKDANRLNIIRMLHAFSVFHFAGHAETREYGGELVLTGNSTIDSLSATDISKLSLPRVQLAVLSACTTAGKTLIPVRDPSGLVKAFLLAGVGQVVASRWDVDSSATSSLMTKLHLARAPANSLSALRFAQNSVMEKKATSHPYYWAGFELFSHLDDRNQR